jgi:cell division septation protein DedD
VQPVIPETLSSTSSDSTTQTSTATPSEAAAQTSAASTATNTSVSASSAVTAPYRVSVGAFGNFDNAQRRLKTFTDAGYPAFIAEQGSLSLVLVGPFDSETEARNASSQISASGLEPNPTIYVLDEGAIANQASSAATPSNTTPTSTPAETSATTTTTSTPAATTTTTSTGVTPPPTASSGRYLQVGAYNNVEGSLPQRQRLEALGFTVQYIQESDLIKLLVGPYDGSNLNTAQSQLSAQGIESFVR